MCLTVILVVLFQILDTPYLLASSTATAQATVAPTIGLLHNAFLHNLLSVNIIVCIRLTVDMQGITELFVFFCILLCFNIAKRIWRIFGDEIDSLPYTHIIE